ncbi:MAG: hypothetical protein FWD37_06055 [Methanomassiliicoccaceae archaeon]|nr:hypothetical protein [Methanomassiliicoccaceae archaeon]
MATSSFYEMLVIDTPEAARNLERAYYAAEKRGPLKLEGPDIEEILESGREYLRNNPNFLSQMAETARKRVIARGEDPYAVVWDDPDE